MSENGLRAERSRSIREATMSAWPMGWVAVMVVAAVGAAEGGAQEARTPRFTLSISAGGIVGGPAASTVRALRDAGFDETSPGGCLFGLCAPEEENPSYQRAGRFGLTLRYELTPTWAVSGGHAWGPFGTARGLRSGSPGVRSEWRGTSYWGAVHRALSSRVGVGAGVALHRMSKVADFENPYSVTRVGILAEAGYRHPWGQRFFLDLTLRGHWVPGARDVRYGAPPPLDPHVSFSTGWSHASLDLGLGVRL